jgi:hypothetical protein
MLAMLLLTVKVRKIDKAVLSFPPDFGPFLSLQFPFAFYFVPIPVAAHSKM